MSINQPFPPDPHPADPVSPPPFGQSTYQPADSAGPTAATSWHEQPPSTAVASAPTNGPDSSQREVLHQVRTEIGKAVVGQDNVIAAVVIALLCQGHVLLEGVPGVAKTLLVRSLAASLNLDTARVQFTPDLMPGDVTGSLIFDTRTSQFSFREGPIFTNLVLADEINRTPPKTQAALLEAMQERQVSVDGQPRPLPDPFVVIATQNPIEFDGTYPLPEAQLDRFLLKLTMAAPSREAEVAMLERHLRGFDPHDLHAAGLRAVASADDLETARRQVEQVSVSEQVLGYVTDVCRATRSAPAALIGASPRASVALLRTSRAWAWMTGRDYLTPDDVKALAPPTLGHRLRLRPEAELEGMSTATVLDSVLASVPTPR